VPFGNLTVLPVPAEIVIHTEPEWRALESAGGRCAQTLARETV
jgi:hypothetical protein